jgi:hypothetical protein
VLQLVRVNGSSMSPALSDGDFVLVISTRLWRRPPLGCVVLAAHPALGPILKRVVRWDAQQGVELRGENGLSSSSADLGVLPRSAIHGVACLRVAADGRVSRLRARR